MKRKVYFNCSFLLIFLMTIGCSNEADIVFENYIRNNETSIDGLALNNEVFVNISKEISTLNMISSESKMSELIKNIKLEKILSPLILNGKQISKLLINDFTNLNNFEIKKADINYINSLSSMEYAQLSFVFSVANLFEQANKRNPTNLKMEDPTVRACLGVALGVVGIYDLLKNTRALGSVTTTIRALKIIGRRYLGWIGVALMIYDFTDCYYGL